MSICILLSASGVQANLVRSCGTGCQEITSTQVHGSYTSLLSAIANQACPPGRDLSLLCTVRARGICYGGCGWAVMGGVGVGGCKRGEYASHTGRPRARGRKGVSGVVVKKTCGSEERRRVGWAMEAGVKKTASTREKKETKVHSSLYKRNMRGVGWGRTGPNGMLS